MFGPFLQMVFFSCKSFFSILIGDEQSHYSQVHYVWNSAAPPKVKVFSWIVALNRQNTMDVLQRRLLFMALSPSICHLCGRDKESGDHIFINCHYSRKVWCYF